MDIQVKVFPNAKHPFVKNETGVYKVYVTAPAVDGKANKALIKILSEHFQTKKSRILITKGLKSRIKTITILGNPSA
jgi:hypothetical protein